MKIPVYAARQNLPAGPLRAFTQLLGPTKDLPRPATRASSLLLELQATETNPSGPPNAFSDSTVVATGRFQGARDVRIANLVQEDPRSGLEGIRKGGSMSLSFQATNWGCFVAAPKSPKHAKTTRRAAAKRLLQQRGDANSVDLTGRTQRAIGGPGHHGHRSCVHHAKFQCDCHTALDAFGRLHSCSSTSQGEGRPLPCRGTCSVRPKGYSRDVCCAIHR